MDLEVTLLAVGTLVTLGITVPLSIKLNLFTKKTFFNVANGDAVAQNIPITAEAGATPITAVGGRDAFAAQEMHIYQGEDNSGKRREALRALRNANQGIVWAIEQSKNPRIGNRPDSYVTKLMDAFEANFAQFKKTDIELLEPIIVRIVDYRKRFSELEIPCTELNKAIDSLS